MADRVAVMQGGELLQVATPEAIYADPADLRVATFIGSPRINTLPAEAGTDGMVRVSGHPVGLWGARPGPLTLAIRPEDLLPAATGLPARAEALEFLGESLLLHARHEGTGTALVLRLPPEARPDLPAAGEGFALQFDTSRALLFGPEGHRVGASVPSGMHAFV
jgi:multiple sugar transport system ATP-binding protein